MKNQLSFLNFSDGVAQIFSSKLFYFVLIFLPFFIFKVDDYLHVIKNPMDFDKMLSKLDKSEYSNAQSFLDDIDLIADNALVRNSLF